ncbi:MAG TPA: PHB depolymerase family esterase [Burkholderiaceae bacterium]|nr:PHB depolymerase family esterase [Burkholderiaceae bacterium]
MNPHFQKLMSQATRLTGSGRLQAATAAIQSALAAAGLTRAAPTPAFKDVIDVQARELPSDARQGVEAPVAEGFIAGSHAGAGLRRDYKLYIPPAAGEQPLPLVVMLHGCTQDPDDFAAGTAMNEAARAQGFYVLYPAQCRRANPQGCWNWFKHSHQQRGRGEPELLAGMTRAVMAEHAIDPSRVYVAGLSAGGAMAAVLGLAYPELYAAIGVHSGLAAGAATDLPSALAAMKNGSAAEPDSAHGRPTIVFHGDADGTVHPANADRIVAACAGATARAESQHVQGEGGRASTRRIYTDTQGQAIAEHWLVHGAPHAWSGGSPHGSYTDSRGPDATAEMLRFFLARPRRPLQ